MLPPIQNRVIIFFAVGEVVAAVMPYSRSCGNAVGRAQQKTVALLDLVGS